MHAVSFLTWFFLVRWVYRLLLRTGDIMCGRSEATELALSFHLLCGGAARLELSVSG